MHDSSLLAQYCIGDFDEVRKSLRTQEDASDFEIDFEIAYIAYITSIFDGEADARDKDFIEAVANKLGWSKMYQQLLQNRIDQHASFSLLVLRLATKSTAYAEVLYRIAYTAARIDGPINRDESFLLGNLETTLFGNTYSKASEFKVRIDSITDGSYTDTWSSWGSREKIASPVATPRAAESESTRSVETYLEELNSLTGLAEVKEEVRRLTSFLKIQKMRSQHDLALTALSLHMVFTGNSGTGKTTVARLVAKIYQAMGFLKKGHLVEIDRTGLVGQYIGHTEEKTKSTIEKALDGILFIDEAYSLSSGGEQDFGQKVIDTLVKYMEDHRERLVVIVAGYKDEMKDFIEANPGLRSRFNTYIDFEDFSVDELFEIFSRICDANHYLMKDDAKAKLREQLGTVVSQRSNDFGNGRYCRNLFEQTIRSQAFRLAAHKGTLDRETLMTIIAEDIP